MCDAARTPLTDACTGSINVYLAKTVSGRTCRAHRALTDDLRAGPRRIRPKHPLRRRTRGHSVRLCHVDERVARINLLTLGRYSSENANTAGNSCSTTQVSPYLMHSSVTESCSPCMQILQPYRRPREVRSLPVARRVRCPSTDCRRLQVRKETPARFAPSVRVCLFTNVLTSVLRRRLRPPSGTRTWRAAGRAQPQVSTSSMLHYRQSAVVSKKAKAPWRYSPTCVISIVRGQERTATQRGQSDRAPIETGANRPSRRVFSHLPPPCCPCQTPPS